MDLQTALMISIVGALVGIVGGLIARKKGKGFRLVVHAIVGIIGAFHGRWLFALIDVHASGMIGHVLFAAVGAALFVYPLRFLRPA